MDLGNGESNGSILDLLFDDNDPVIGNVDFTSLLQNSVTNNKNDVPMNLFPDLLSLSDDDMDFMSMMKDFPDPFVEPSNDDRRPGSESSSLTDDQAVTEGSLETCSPPTENVFIDIEVEKVEMSSPENVHHSSDEDLSGSDEPATMQTEETIIVLPYYCEEIVESVSLDIGDDVVNTVWPEVKLTPEERRLMDKEGIKLPSRYPLTKEEESNLKKIKRKIRNKLSAQDSRKRKKVYIDGLESRVKTCTEQNFTLKKKVQILESKNKSLLAELKKLQAYVSKCSNVHVQTSTCVLVLLLSFVFVMSPNLGLFAKSNKALSTDIKTGSSRVLLSVNTRTPQLDENELTQSQIADKSAKIYDVDGSVPWTDGDPVNDWSGYSSIINAEDGHANASVENPSKPVTVEVPLVK